MLALMLSCLGHSFRARAQMEGMTIFSDAAECRRGRSRVGIVGCCGPYKSYLCLRWIKTLQQGELWGVYVAAKIAVCIAENSRGEGAAGRKGLRVGTDSESSRYQVLHGHVATRLKAHQRILRRPFWLRTWLRATISIFRVASADPLRRFRSFDSKQEVKAEANRHLKIWE